MKIEYTSYTGDQKRSAKCTKQEMCCPKAEEVFTVAENSAIRFFSNYENDYRAEVCIHDSESGYDGVERDYYAINSCPFCAAPIELKETKRIHLTKVVKKLPVQEMREYVSYEETEVLCCPPTPPG